MLISAAAELITFGSFIPFLIAITSKNDFQNNNIILYLSNLLGRSDENYILIFCVIIFMIAGLISAFIRTCNLWFNTRLAAAIGSDISKKAYKKLLLQPYESHISTNSSKKVAALIVHLNASISSLFLLFQLITSSIVSLIILMGFIFIDFPYGLIAPLLFGLAYLSISLLVKGGLKRNSFKIANAENKKIKILRESLDSIRDLIIDNSHDIFIKEYHDYDLHQRRFRAKNWFLNSAPRFSLESLAILVIGIIALIILARKDISSLVTTLGILAIGSQRLLPSLQQIYSYWSNLKGSLADIKIVLSILNKNIYKQPKVNISINFSNKIIFENINFKYGECSNFVFKNLNLEIFKGDCIGIVGDSGSGKSTLVDLIMGLLKPKYGNIFVDNLLISSKDELISSWRKNVAHVPQRICLIDSNFSQNIAFGRDLKDINMKRIKKCAEKANISDFIESFDEKYNKSVGERGFSLSGGQMQRIGIARALYKKSNLLVLDEATSALDLDTENKIMNEIYSLKKDLTIIIVAHRENTLKKCNKIFKVENQNISIIKNDNSE